MMRHDKVGQDDHCYLIDRNCNPMMVDGEYISSGDTMRNGVSIVGFDCFEDYRECLVDKDCHVLSDRFEEISYIGKKEYHIQTLEFMLWCVMAINTDFLM